MADDPYSAILPHQIAQGFEGDIKRLIVEVAKPLVNEDRIELDAPGLGLDHIGQPQRQGQRGQEALPA